MYKVSEEFHEKYADMYDNFVRIVFKDGTEKVGLWSWWKMKKWLKSVGITFVLMAIICMVFWKIEWISSWKEVVTLYGIVVVVIAISTLITYIRTKIVKK